MTSADASQYNRDLPEWWAVYTRHQHEKAVADNLTEHGVEAFLPLCQTVRQWKDRKKRLLLPLFPCYVFVRGSSERRVQVISTPGVFSVVSMAGHPAPIPATEIEAIRRAVGSSLRVEPHPFLRCGDWVRIKSGPLTNVEGILIRKKGSYRLILSADLLQKSLAVEVDAFSVEPLPHRAAGLAYSTSRANALFQNHITEGLAPSDRGYAERLS